MPVFSYSTLQPRVWKYIANRQLVSALLWRCRNSSRVQVRHWLNSNAKIMRLAQSWKVGAKDKKTSWRHWGQMKSRAQVRQARGQQQGQAEPHGCYNLKNRRRERTFSNDRPQRGHCNHPHPKPSTGASHPNEGLTVTGDAAPIF